MVNRSLNRIEVERIVRGVSGVRVFVVTILRHADCDEYLTRFSYGCEKDVDIRKRVCDNSLVGR